MAEKLNALFLYSFKTATSGKQALVRSQSPAARTASFSVSAVESDEEASHSWSAALRPPTRVPVKSTRWHRR